VSPPLLGPWCFTHTHTHAHKHTHALTHTHTHICTNTHTCTPRLASQSCCLHQCSAYGTSHTHMQHTHTHTCIVDSRVKGVVLSTSPSMVISHRQAHTYTHTHLHTCTHTHTQMHRRLASQECCFLKVSVYGDFTHTNTRTHAHTHTHARTNTHTCILESPGKGVVSSRSQSMVISRRPTHTHMRTHMHAHAHIFAS